MLHRKTFILSLSAAAALAACGGGSSSSPDIAAPSPVVATPAAAKGVMIDGYVRGATVFCDSNSNGALDTTEARTTTSAGGSYEISGGCDASVVGFGGTNVDTGYPFDGLLKTPKGSTALTPLTSMLVGSGLTSAQLAAALGLDAGTDVTKIDVANGQHPALFKKTLAIQQVFDNLARMTALRTGSNDLASAYARLSLDFAKGLATAPAGTPIMSASGAVNSAAFGTVVRGMPDVAALNVSAADLEVAVNTLAGQAQQFSAAAGTVNIVELSKTLQNPVRTTLDVTATTKYLALAGDSLVFNGDTVPTEKFASGIALDGLDTIGVPLSVIGTPAADSVASVALELVERGGDRRKLQLLIDTVSFKVSAQGVVSVAVAPTAKVHAYGFTANGTEVNLTISDLAFTPIRVVDNGFTLNYTSIVKKVTASSDVAGRTTAERFLGIKGEFDTRVVISGVNIRKTDSSSYPTQSVSIPNTTKTISGPGLSGILTIR